MPKKTHTHFRIHSSHMISFKIHPNKLILVQSVNRKEKNTWSFICSQFRLAKLPTISATRNQISPSGLQAELLLLAFQLTRAHPREVGVDVGGIFFGWGRKNKGPVLDTLVSSYLINFYRVSKGLYIRFGWGFYHVLPYLTMFQVGFCMFRVGFYHVDESSKNPHCDHSDPQWLIGSSAYVPNSYKKKPQKRSLCQ